MPHHEDTWAMCGGMFHSEKLGGLVDSEEWEPASNGGSELRSEFSPD